MEWQMSAAIVVSLVSGKAVDPTDEKAHEPPGPSERGEKSACDNTTPDLLISQLKFIHPGRSERAKQSQSLLAVVMFHWQMDSLHERTHVHTPTLESCITRRHSSPLGGVGFLILIYTAINQNPLPGALARLSQWKAQAGGTLIAIYRGSRAWSGTSTPRPLFCSSLFPSLITRSLNWWS